MLGHAVKAVVDHRFAVRQAVVFGQLVVQAAARRAEGHVVHNGRSISNPGIKEVDYEDVKQVLKELKTYMKVPKDAVKNVRVFDVEDLLFFLENAVGVFKI